MTIARLTTSWPPRIGHPSKGDTVIRPGLDDIAVGAEIWAGAVYHFTLHLRKSDATEYAVLIYLPDQLLLGKAVSAINAYRVITLGQVGELDIP